MHFTTFFNGASQNWWLSKKWVIIWLQVKYTWSFIFWPILNMSNHSGNIFLSYQLIVAPPELHYCCWLRNAHHHHNWFESGNEVILAMCVRYALLKVLFIQLERCRLHEVLRLSIIGYLNFGREFKIKSLMDRLSCQFLRGSLCLNIVFILISMLTYARFFCLLLLKQSPDPMPLFT